MVFIHFMPNINMDTPQLILVLLLAVTCAADAKGINCTEITCPHGTVPALIEGASAVPCPEDSHRPLVSNMNIGEKILGADECCLAPCKCIVPCLPPPSLCPANTHTRVSKPATGRPGACCPTYQCASSDEEVDLPAEPPALALHSPRPHSSGFVMEPPPGGCVSETTGGIMANGYEWREDPCTTCKCEAGKRKCFAYMCQASCVNPQHVPGECCPVCDSTSVVTLPPHCPSLANCSLRCRQGLLKDKEGCFLCQCQAEECKLDCPQGYSEDSLGNKLCQCAEPAIPPHCPFLTSCRKNCTHGLRTNRLGCPVCKCNKCRQMVFSSSTPNTDGGSTGTLLDSSAHGIMLLCQGPCVYGYVKDDRGCPTCMCNGPPLQSEEITTAYSEDVTRSALSCLSSDGTERSSGDSWWDGCHKCHCIQGSERCTMVSCPPTQQTCDHPIIIHGQCCPVCTDVYYSKPMEHWIIITAIVVGILLLVIIVLAMKLMRRSWWWPRRGCSCIQGIDEDGGGKRLDVSPSPSPTHSPVATSPINGTCKSLSHQCSIPQLYSRPKGVREYKYVPTCDTASVENEKTFALH